jgi:hypothetical protein
MLQRVLHVRKVSVGFRNLRTRHLARKLTFGFQVVQSHGAMILACK